MFEETRGAKIVVSAADFVRNFGQWRDVGNQKPVFITHHHRESHVFLSISQYMEATGGSASEQFPDPLQYFTAMACWLNDGLILCDHALQIVEMNSSALGICDVTASHHLKGVVQDVIPSFAKSLIEVHVQRTLSTGESSAADMPSPFREGNWLHVRTFPLQNFVGILLRDITEDVRTHRLADAKKAVIEAISLHGNISYVRVSARGLIDSVAETFCEWIGLPQHRLHNVAISDLILAAARPKFREAMEDVLRGKRNMVIDTQILSNNGLIIPMSAAIAQMSGAYGAEGAIMIFTIAPETITFSKTKHFTPPESHAA